MWKGIWNCLLQAWTLLVVAEVQKEQNLFLQLPDRKEMQNSVLKTEPALEPTAALVLFFDFLVSPNFLAPLILSWGSFSKGASHFPPPL